MRNDKNPTCTFYYDRAGRLIFHDHAGYFHGDCFEVVKYMHRISYGEALFMIARDFNLVNPNLIPEKRTLKRSLEEIRDTKTEIKVKRREWDLQDKKFWKSFALNGTILEKYKVTPAQVVWVNGEVVYNFKPDDPCYIYYFGEGDYKLYFPMRNDYRFMCNTKKLQGYDQLPDRGELLVVSKSMKDCMVFYSLNIAATAPQSEGAILTPEQYSSLSQRFKQIVSNYDFDRAGIRSALKMRDQYGIQPLFLTNGKFKTQNYGTKDISDFVRKFGTQSAHELITNTYNEIIA